MLHDRPMLPGRHTQRLFETMFPVNEMTRSEVTDDGGHERYERARLVRLLVIVMPSSYFTTYKSR